MISFADLSLADHHRSAQGRVHFINACSSTTTAKPHEFFDHTGSPTVLKARKSPKILAWFVPCPLAAHPAAVLISFAWLRKVLHCVVSVAVQRKQGDA